ncbi:uncharacterized protein [Amphiura filiformis]|uniref:uncharacterized protein n=1 Tax=Amphiura filiformis TaxID=82378 RepID=UPI003B220C4C
MSSAKTLLQTKNVPDINPLQDMNASKAFLDKYTDALVLTAASSFFGMDKVTDQPTKNCYNPSIHANHLQYTQSVLGEFVDKYALPSEEDMTSAAVIKCPMCKKQMKEMEPLRKHIKEKHQRDPSIKDSHDAVYAYSCATLSMCMLAKEFDDGRQLGDGPRLLRTLKYMLLYFRSTGKTKYSLQVLRHLAQIKCFLTPQEAEHATWDRFVNCKGRIDSNKEMDRTIEHENRIFKTQARHLHGQVQQRTVDRISKSCQHIDKVLIMQDKATKRRSSSGKRRQPDQDEDVVQLVDHMKQERIFEVNSQGRFHQAFPGFTRGYVISVDHRNLHNWMTSSLGELSRKHKFLPPR